MSEEAALTERYDPAVHKVANFGASLLNDAFERIARAAREVAVRAVVLHAINETAADFYERFGFRSLSTTPRTLMVTLAELKEAGYER